MSIGEWAELFTLDPNYIASWISVNSNEKRNANKISEPSVIVEKFNESCSDFAEKMLNRMNLDLIAVYDATLTEHLLEQNSIRTENILLETSPMLKENAERHFRTMIAYIRLLNFLWRVSFKWGHNVNPLKFVDKIARCERKIVDAVHGFKLRPVTKQIFQKYSMLLWESLNKSNKDDITRAGVWLSTVLREKAKKWSSKISTAVSENKMQKEQTKVKKGAHKKRVENLDNETLIDENEDKFDGQKFKSNKVKGDKLMENSSNDDENGTDKLKNLLVRNHESDLIAEKMAVTSETPDEVHQQKLLPQLNNSAGKASYPPYTLDTLNDCALVLTKIISEIDDFKSDDLLTHCQSPQVEVRDLSLVFVGNVSTESAAESDDQKRLKAVEGNFLFAAYRAIVYALKQNEKSVECSHLNGLIERNKRIFVDIILRSKKFEQIMTEQNAPNSNVCM